MLLLACAQAPQKPTEQVKAPVLEGINPSMLTAQNTVTGVFPCARLLCSDHEIGTDYYRMLMDRKGAVIIVDMIQSKQRRGIVVVWVREGLSDSTIEPFRVKGQML